MWPANAAPTHNHPPLGPRWPAKLGCHIGLSRPTGLCSKCFPNTTDHLSVSLFSDTQVLPPAFDAFANDEQLQPRGVKRP